MIRRTVIFIFSLLLCSGAYAGNKHHPPPPEPVNVPDDGSNHNALIIGVAIMAAVCAYHRCWKTKPVQDNEPNRITPELPSDRLIIRPKQ